MYKIVPWFVLTVNPARLDENVAVNVFRTPISVSFAFGVEIALVAGAVLLPVADVELDIETGPVYSAITTR